MNKKALEQSPRFRPHQMIINYCLNIQRGFKQKNFVNDLLASFLVNDPNRVFWLTNKIPLFQYSEGIFSALRRGMASKLL